MFQLQQSAVFPANYDILHIAGLLSLGFKCLLSVLTQTVRIA